MRASPVVEQPLREHRRPPYRRPFFRDAAFLSSIVLFSTVLYVFGLGFYSDDWTVLGYASMTEDQTLMGIFRGDLRT